MRTWAFLGRVGLAAASFVFAVSSVHGELTAPQVLIVANNASPHSVQLATRYAQARGVPERNIIALRCPVTDVVSRKEYDRLISLPIRTFIQEQDLSDKIKVIVTVYGVPLTVGPAQPGMRERQLAEELTARYRREFRELEDLLHQFRGLAGLPATQPTTFRARDDPAQFREQGPQIVRLISEVAKQVQEAIDRLKDVKSKRQLFMRALDLSVRIRGLGNLPRDRADPQQEGRLRELGREFQALRGQSPTERDRTRSYELARQLGGELLVVSTLREDISRLNEQESLAAVDDELTLVMHPEHILAGRLPNILNERLAEHGFASKWKPVFMTARLDGTAPAVVERMIHDAIRAEAEGLNGTVYIDARGMKPDDTHFAYDEDLRVLARLLQEKTKLKTVLDDRGEVFPPGSCPQAALYCGWYSLGKYVPAFTFVPGAVGYHIASFEAKGLHDPTATSWCPRLLEVGVCATIGPVDEPFLDAFPLASEFFPMLLCGKYTLVEAFFKTKRYNSWRVILLGDPLYRPFARNPQMDEPDLKRNELMITLFP